MATRNRRKFEPIDNENCEKHPRSNLAQNSNAPRSQEDYITQVSEEIEGRVTKRLSKEFSRTKNRILGALTRPDDFLMNPLIQDYSGNAPETSRNALSTNQGLNDNDSRSDPHPEAGIFTNQMTQNFRPEFEHYMVTRATERHDMVTGVQRESLCGRDMVTGATKQIGNRHDITGVHEEVTYCSPSTSSGKRKRNRSTSQPSIRSENTPPSIEADQILLALQQ